MRTTVNSPVNILFITGQEARISRIQDAG